jgi:predicted esterase
MLRVRWLWWLPVAPLLGVCALVFEANGGSVTTLASFTLPALCVTLALGRRAATAVVVTIGVGFIASRFGHTPPTAVQACVEARCSSGSAWWQRLVDEREATRAGLYLSGHLGSMGGAEFKRFDALIDAQWKSAPPAWRNGPNPLLMSSSPSRVESLRFSAAGPRKRPAIVFLHGFGGLLSLYVRAVVDGTHGEFDVIAPALDPLGAWWTERGQAVIAHTLDTLPPEVDRSRVYLIGLSNGGIGASEVLLHAELARRFAGVVLLSGAGRLETLEQAPPTRVLMLSGTRDWRFQGDWVAEQHAQLEALGADVTWKTFEADHFLLLTHTAAWARAFTDWARATSGGSVGVHVLQPGLDERLPL